MKSYQIEAKSQSVSGGSGKVVGTFNHGDVIMVWCNPTQQWFLAKDWGTNANGFNDHYSQKGGQVFHTGAMVGSFDNGKTFFSVGTYLEMTVTSANDTSGAAATLKLYCWDSDNANNYGYIDAHVAKKH